MRRFFGLGGDGREYRANAVQFDGSNDYLTRGAELTGIADGKAGTLSVWLDFTGGDAANQHFLSNGTTNVALLASRLSTNKFRVFARNSADTIILQIDGDTAFTAASGWIHFLCAWNLATPVARMFINDVNDEAAGATETDDTIDYVDTGEWSFGALTDGTVKIDADVADFWFDDSFIDISTEANRRLFISPNLKPVNLGETGQLPTGSSPLVFLSGATTGWESNLGTGGGFTENGALTDGSSSPSD